MAGQSFTPQLLHPAILMGAVVSCAVVSFHPPFGLRRTGSDDLDSQALAHPAKLRNRRLAAQTLSFRRLALVDILPIGVQGLRHLILADPCLQHAHCCPDRLLFSQPTQDDTGGVIHHVHQTTLWVSSFQPSMEAAVQLHQFAKVTLALTPLVERLAFPLSCP